MLRIRVSEEVLVGPIISGEIRCPVHLYSGEEAIATGLCAHLTREDYVFGNHRSHGHYLAKGGNLKAMMAEILGREAGCSGGRGGSMHLIAPEVGVMGIAPIVSGTISLAVGAALASSIRNDSRVTVSFFGDGATGEGVLVESMNFASLRHLPIIFACENNLYSTHLPIAEIRSRQDIVSLAGPLGIRGFQVDGNNVMDVYEVASEATSLCREGKGPVFIEFLTYRQRGHVGPDDNIQGSHTDIRPLREIELWMAKDPVRLFEKYIIDQNILPFEKIGSIKENVNSEVQEALAYARACDEPNPEDLLKYVWK